MTVNVSSATGLKIKAEDECVYAHQGKTNMTGFSYLEPVCCSVSSSNCCFLTCIQVSQEADQVVWYSHLFQNFPFCYLCYKALSSLAFPSQCLACLQVLDCVRFFLQTTLLISPPYQVFCDSSQKRTVQN